MTLDIEKAKQALATLQAKKQAQQQRLQLAAEFKRKIDNNNELCTQSLCKGNSKRI